MGNYYDLIKQYSIILYKEVWVEEGVDIYPVINSTKGLGEYQCTTIYAPITNKETPTYRIEVYKEKEGND